MKTLLYNAKIVGEDGLLDSNCLLIEDGVITGFEFVDANKKIDCEGKYIFPGFVDIHVHGGGGADFMDGSVDAMETAIETHLRHGTTTIYPTTLSAEISEIKNTFKVFRDFIVSKKCRANVFGLHLEGPFINPKMSGAQRPDLIFSPTGKDVQLLKNNADIIARITCAPEVDGVLHLVEELLPYGISFSMGHTMATYGQAETAVDKGFSSVTHLYSATSGFHKANQKVCVGVTQAAYGIDELYAELIGDGCHVPKELLRLVVRFKGVDKICLVTDAMRAAGTSVAESYLGKISPENRVIIDDGVAKLPDKSSFAGSIGTMDKALQFAVNKANLTLSMASKILSLTPSRLMGIDNKKGSIQVGKDADLVVIDENLEVQNVYIKGIKV